MDGGEFDIFICFLKNFTLEKNEKVSRDAKGNKKNAKPRQWTLLKNGLITKQLSHGMIMRQ